MMPKSQSETKGTKMMFHSEREYISLSFRHGHIKQTHERKSTVDIFFGITGELLTLEGRLINILSSNEKARADQFRNESERLTFLFGHSILRLELFRKLNTDPLNLKIEQGPWSKPYIRDNPLYFNLTHSREAFAFAVSQDLYLGIDLEELDHSKDISSIAGSFFNSEEVDYILRPDSDPVERFYLLWTRKEAFLKAIGSGIIDNVTQFGVCKSENYINRNIFENLIPEGISDNHFICSARIGNYCLSLAVPEKALVRFHHLDMERVVSGLDKLQVYAIS
jgi:phosphopantetheinyl transferase